MLSFNQSLNLMTTANFEKKYKKIDSEPYELKDNNLIDKNNSI